jgi:hypothetical protein
VNPVPALRLRPAQLRNGAALLTGLLLLATFGTPAMAAPKPAPAAALKPAPGPAAAPLPDPVENDIESQLQQMLTDALHLGADSQLRTLVRNIAGRQLDNDTDAPLTTVIAEAETFGMVDPNESWWQQLKSEVQYFVVDGYQYEPQIHIPNLDEGIFTSDQVPIVVKPADETADTVPGYWLDAAGNVQQTPDLDETYADTNEVWVLTVSEQTNSAAAAATKPATKPAAKPAAQAPSAAVSGPQMISPMSACNSTGVRNNRGQEYLVAWRVPNKRAFGGWLSGKTEMRLVVVGSSGAVIKNYFFPKVKRKNIPNWQNFDVFVTTWDRAVWGDVMGYQWYELDGGKTVSTEISVPLQGGGSIKTTITTQARDDDGGSAAVLFGESTYITYSTGKVEFQVCSQGGDGGTGNDNLACGATASASSTFGGYSAAKATDCNADTRLGGAYSWANARTTYPPNNPEWLQADFGVNKTFRRVVVYTSEGYPMKDFDVQVWNGVNFGTVASVRGNSALSVPVSVGSQTTRLVRILCRSGPDHQPGFVRINELEVYAV